MIFRPIENHPNCPLTYFRWVTLLFVHDPIPSNDGVSSKPRAIHSDLQVTMHFVSHGKSHIREQVENLN